MKSVLLFTLLLLPALGFSATLSGSITDSTATVTLPNVGTLDWSHWSRGTNKAGIISPITAIGWPETFWNGLRIISDSSGVLDRSGMRVTGAPGSFQFTVPATSAERTLYYYIGGWNSSGRVTVSLPGAPTYTTEFQQRKSYNSIVTIRFSGNEGSVLTVRHEQTAGPGDIIAQAAALQGGAGPAPEQSAAAPPVSRPANAGSAVLNWVAPTQDTNGRALTDLTGFKLYWYPASSSPSASTSFTVYNLSARTYTLTGLSPGEYNFVMTAITAGGEESAYSNPVSKSIQ